MNKKQNIHATNQTHSDDKIEVVSISALQEELKNKITRALDNYKNGGYITHDQLKQKVAKWLTYR